ncbi:MAG: hypothetical protein K2L37_05600 [Lactobacillus sp.]|nr:hypothetical protein [Lactobacillus sp.]
MIDLNTGSFRAWGQSYIGFWWSKTASISGSGIWGVNSYTLGYNQSAVSPSYGPSARWLGFPVRCLVY